MPQLRGSQLRGAYGVRNFMLVQRNWEIFGECNICCRLPVESQKAATASRVLMPNYFQSETTGVLHFSWMMLRHFQFNAELGGSVGTPKL